MIPAAGVRRIVARLGRDEDGISMVEFSLLAPFMGLLIVGIADYGRGFSERYALESAAHRTLERAAVASTENGYAHLLDEAKAAAGNDAIVTFDNWLECDGARMPGYDSVCADGAQVARYIYVRIERDFTPSFRWTGGGRPPIRISGDAAVRVQ